MSSDPNTRPSERFAGDTGTLDLEREATDLLEHAVGSEHGHAQRTLYRHGGVTIAMFAFREHATLPPHAVDGVVSVHVLRGRVTMTAGDSRFELVAAHLVRMTPKVTHDVSASSPSVVLIHIAQSAPETTGSDRKL